MMISRKNLTQRAVLGRYVRLQADPEERNDLFHSPDAAHQQVSSESVNLIVSLTRLAGLLSFYYVCPEPVLSN
jgi:hypothetical protein